MTIRHLRIFIAVAEAGKMGLAAKQLYIAQPTVSQVISDMERSYGVKLFERLSKKLYITPQGERLLSYARHIVSLFDEMERSMRNSSAQVLLRVGATITVGACVLSPIIHRYEELFPLSQVQVFVDNTRLIEEMLLESQLDVALVEGLVESPDLCTLPVIEDELVLACAPITPLPSGRPSIRRNWKGRTLSCGKRGREHGLCLKIISGPDKLRSTPNGYATAPIPSSAPWKRARG